MFYVLICLKVSHCFSAALENVFVIVPLFLHLIDESLIAVVV